MRGYFISMEGIDGLGKSTQFHLLATKLKSLGVKVTLTKEPGDEVTGSNVGAGVRRLLFQEPTTKRMRPGVADLLFLADHVQTSGDIEEAVLAGEVVLSDRYVDSQFAYGAGKAKATPPWVMRMFEERQGISPNLTLLLVARGPKQVLPLPMLPGIVHQLISIREDIGWALERSRARRGAEAGKQDGKAWNSIEEQRIIQNAYLERLGPLHRTAIFDVYEGTTVEELHYNIAEVVRERMRNWLAHQHKKQEVYA